MQDELKELRLGPRGQAQQRRLRGEEHAATDGDALDAAFADYASSKRADKRHRSTTWNPQQAAQEISAQLEQLETQRERLARLLESLDGVVE